MADTYTFTARSAYDPKRMAIFTLQDGHLFVDFGGALLEQMEPESPAREEGEERLPAILKPTSGWLLQQLLRPFRVADVYARAEEDGGFKVTAWLRANGLRSVPAILQWKQVDNPEAAHSFVAELNERKKSAETRGRFPGLLDYWATWITAGFALVIFAWQTARRISRDENETGGRA